MSGGRLLHVETVPATILRVALGGSAMMIFAVAAFLPAELQVRVIIALAGVAELLLLIVLHSMTVEVRSDALELRFGAGVFRRRYPIGTIAAAAFHAWTWRSGAGVRLGLSGTIYLVARGDIVEIRLQSGRRILFSAADGRKVVRALGEAGVADIGG